MTGECECCESKGVALREVRRPGVMAGAEDTAKVCGLCLSLGVLSAQTYARQDAATLTGLAIVGNRVLAALVQPSVGSERRVQAALLSIRNSLEGWQPEGLKFARVLLHPSDAQAIIDGIPLDRETL